MQQDNIKMDLEETWFENVTKLDNHNVFHKNKMSVKWMLHFPGNPVFQYCFQHSESLL